ncbi:MAG: GH3 auxin-responsive promoter family protein [Fimbriimonadaceae bacterium]|nr:GH3 auxin-responsive promoter family protein [Chitinophagales bacterium]
MGIKSLLSKPFASVIAAQVKAQHKNPVDRQLKVMQHLIVSAKETQFGIDHHFNTITSHKDFVKQITVRDYEGLKPYIEKLKEGKENILWKGKPIYFAKTSGTTSGVKYIPITKESMPNHITSARNALLLYINETKKAAFTEGKMIFLQGSPALTDMHGIKVGRLSGLVYNHVPNYLLKNRLPSYETNCIEDWELKVETICKETMHENMSLISGIPPWVLMYFEKLIELSRKEKIKDIFKNFSLFVYGGVNYEPYRAKIENIIGKKIDSIETYPASEGFIAYQDSQQEEGLLLNVDSGIFFEFIPSSEVFNENPTRLTLADIELGINYVVIINSNAGLWGYNIGDTIKFVSTTPHRIVVTGRIKHFISAFGEHVIGEEVEYALLKVAEEQNIHITEFTVAPQVTPENNVLPYHEWFIEFEQAPNNLESFASLVDEQLQQKNIYYKDLITGKILHPLKITIIEKNGFREYMKSMGKLGGQNKAARLSNDRTIANELQRWVSRS